MAMSVTARIDSSYSNLTKSEVKLANYTKKHLDTVYHESLAQMAKNAKVGEATVVRFIHKIGFESFASFKIAVSYEQMQRESQQTQVNHFEKVQQDLNYMFGQTILANTEEDIEEVVKMMEESSFVYFYGMGASGYSAQVADYRFFRAGLKCTALTDADFMTMRASVLSEGELVIAISASGDNSLMNRALEAARATKCKIVGITSYRNTEITKLVDKVLYASTISSSSLENAISIRTIMNYEFLIDMLFTVYRERNRQAVEASQNKTITSTSYHHDSLMEK